jgi:hypothetical protein
MVERGPPVADVCPGPIPFDDIVDASSAAAATPMLELIFLTTVSLCASAGIVVLPVTGRSTALSGASRGRCGVDVGRRCSTTPADESPARFRASDHATVAHRFGGGTESVHGD